jgi:hypothetical protein
LPILGIALVTDAGNIKENDGEDEFNYNVL